MVPLARECIYFQYRVDCFVSDTRHLDGVDVEKLSRAPTQRHASMTRVSWRRGE